MNVEDELRRALRRVDPPAGFAERVMRALPERRVPAPVVALADVRQARRPGLWQRLSTPAALAASLVVAVFVGQHVAVDRVEREQRAGLEARRELMQALRVTSQKLDVAYQAIQGPAPGATGNEENRS